MIARHVKRARLWRTLAVPSLTVVAFLWLFAAAGASGDKSIVGIARNDDRAAATREAIRLAGGLNEVIQPGSWVVIKPNGTIPKPPETAVVTHPEVLRAVIEMVKEAGAGKISVAESGGTRRPDGSPLLETAGWDKVIQGTGVEWISINSSPTRTVRPKDAVGMKEYEVCPAILNCDVLISVAVLKTHNTAMLTGALKNMFGIVPGYKVAIHKALAVDTSIADLNKLHRLDFAVVGVCPGMEGYGPSGGPPVDLQAVLAGRDAVAVDAVGAEIMGYNPYEIKHLVHCERLGLGTADHTKIEVRGVPVSELRRRFARPWGPGLEGEISRAYVPERGVTFFWLGQGGFAFKTDQDEVLVVDPYISNACKTPRLAPPALVPRDVRGDYERSQKTLMPDYILCTHDHLDHTDPDAIPELAETSQARFVGPPLSGKVFRDKGLPDERIIQMSRGDTKNLGSVKVTAVYAKHTDDSVGYVLDFGGVTVYITGDTLWDARLTEVARYKPDILMVCVNGKWGNMNVSEAARLTTELRPKIVVPMHWGMFAHNTVDPQDFVLAAKDGGVKAKILIMEHMGCHVCWPFREKAASPGE